MTGDGRWRRLARLVVRRDLWPTYGLRDCADCPHADRFPDAPECLAVPRGRPMDSDWESCPMRELRLSRHFDRALELHHAAQVSPLADWPHGYAPWAVEALCAIKRALTEHEADAVQSARDGAGHVHR